LYKVTAGERQRQGLRIGAIAGALAIGYYLIMMLVPPPGGVAGDLSPEGNLGAHLDRALMDGHLWKPRWDPEGLLSTMPAVATTLFGIVAGLFLGSEETQRRKAPSRVSWGSRSATCGIRSSRSTRTSGRARTSC
jgi:predicted acyltransferase